MHGIPSPSGLDQGRTRELIEPSAGLLNWHTGERGGGIRVQIGAGMQAQQLEGAGSVGVQVLE